MCGVRWGWSGTERRTSKNIGSMDRSVKICKSMKPVVEAQVGEKSCSDWCYKLNQHILTFMLCGVSSVVSEFIQVTCGLKEPGIKPLTF